VIGWFPIGGGFGSCKVLDCTVPPCLPGHSCVFLVISPIAWSSCLCYLCFSVPSLTSMQVTSHVHVHRVVLRRGAGTHALGITQALMFPFFLKFVSCRLQHGRRGSLAYRGPATGAITTCQCGSTGSACRCPRHLFNPGQIPPPTTDGPACFQGLARVGRVTSRRTLPRYHKFCQSSISLSNS